MSLMIAFVSVVGSFGHQFLNTFKNPLDYVEVYASAEKLESKFLFSNYSESLVSLFEYATCRFVGSGSSPKSHFDNGAEFPFWQIVFAESIILQPNSSLSLKNPEITIHSSDGFHNYIDQIYVDLSPEDFTKIYPDYEEYLSKKILGSVSLTIDLNRAEDRLLIWKEASRLSVEIPIVCAMTSRDGGEYYFYFPIPIVKKINSDDTIFAITRRDVTDFLD